MHQAVARSAAARVTGPLVPASTASITWKISASDGISERYAYTALVALTLGENAMSPEVATTQFRVEAAH